MCPWCDVPSHHGHMSTVPKLSAETPLLVAGSWLLKSLCPGVDAEHMAVDVPALSDHLREISPAIGTIHWFDATRLDKEMFSTHQDMAVVPGMQLHLGTLRQRNGSWVQKQTDSLIVTTLIELALAGQRDLVLLGGDEDLIPGVSFAQQLGSNVHLWSIHNTARVSTPADTALAKAADHLAVIDVDAMSTAVTRRVSVAAQAMKAMIS